MDQEQVGAAWRHLTRTLTNGSGFNDALGALRSWSATIGESVARGAYTLWRIGRTTATRIADYFRTQGQEYDDGGALDGTDPILSTPIGAEAAFPETMPGGVLFPNGRSVIEWTYKIEITKEDGTTEYVTGRTKLHARDNTDAAILDILEHLQSLRSKYPNKSFLLIEDSIREIA